MIADAREGRTRLFRGTPARIDEARRRHDAIAAHWDAALDRLAARARS